MTPMAAGQGQATQLDREFRTFARTGHILGPTTLLQGWAINDFAVVCGEEGRRSARAQATKADARSGRPRYRGRMGGGVGARRGSPGDVARRLFVPWWEASEDQVWRPPIKAMMSLVANSLLELLLQFGHVNFTSKNGRPSAPYSPTSDAFQPRPAAPHGQTIPFLSTSLSIAS